MLILSLTHSQYQCQVKDLPQTCDQVAKSHLESVSSRRVGPRDTVMWSDEWTNHDEKSFITSFIHQKYGTEFAFVLYLQFPYQSVRHAKITTRPVQSRTQQ